MNAYNIPRIKWVIRHFSKVQAENLVKELLQLSHAEEICERVENAFNAIGLENLLRA